MRGRDAIAVALRHPDGEIVFATERLDAGFHGTRWSKWPLIRGLVVLYETLVVGTRWLVRSANVQAEEEGVELGKGSVVLMLALTLAAGVGIFFLLPLFVASVTTQNVENGNVQHLVEGLVRVAIFLGYLWVDRPLAGHPARLPVPRRRAHDDPRPRGGRSADRRRGPQVPDGPPALRHRVPGRRHPAVDHRLLVRRAADAAGHDRQPHPAHPGHRRRRLRDPAVRGAPSEEPAGQGPALPGPARPEDHHQAADRRHDRGRDRLDGAGAHRRRRIGPGRLGRLRAATDAPRAGAAAADATAQTAPPTPTVPPVQTVPTDPPPGR